MERIDLLKQYLAKTPDDSFLRHALSLEYIKLKEDQKAIELFEKLLADDPDYVGSFYHLGKAYERIGKMEHAAEIYEKGMLAARKLKDDHAYRELQQAADDLA